MTRQTNIDDTHDDESLLQTLLAESPSDFDSSDDPLSDDIDLNPTPSTELLLAELELHIRARSTLLKTGLSSCNATSRVILTNPLNLLSRTDVELFTGFTLGLSNLRRDELPHLATLTLPEPGSARVAILTPEDLTSLDAEIFHATGLGFFVWILLTPSLEQTPPSWQASSFLIDAAAPNPCVRNRLIRAIWLYLGERYRCNDNLVSYWKVIDLEALANVPLHQLYATVELLAGCALGGILPEVKEQQYDLLGFQQPLNPYMPLGRNIEAIGDALKSSFIDAPSIYCPYKMRNEKKGLWCLNWRDTIHGALNQLTFLPAQSDEYASANGVAVHIDIELNRHDSEAATLISFANSWNVSHPSLVATVFENKDNKLDLRLTALFIPQAGARHEALMDFAQSTWQSYDRAVSDLPLKKGN